MEPVRRPTLADVARAAKVSTSTASVVFSGRAPVSASLRARVLAAAAELDYAGPDPRAASLRRGRSGIVAVVLQGPLRTVFLDPVTIATMDGLTDALATLGASVLLVRDDSEPERSLATTPVDAVVLIGSSERSQDDLELLRSRGIPRVVLEGEAGGDIPQITLDNREAARDVAAHVSSLGHRDVAVVTLPVDRARARGPVTADRLRRATVDVTRERLAGIREVFPEAPAVSAASSSIDEGLIAGRAVLDAAAPTAILAQSDLLAAGVIRAAEERGLRIPEDLSVTGFDGIKVDGLGDHVLTTTVQPANEKGRAAGEQIARMLSGEPGLSLHLTCRFRKGTTTAPPRR